MVSIIQETAVPDSLTLERFEEIQKTQAELYENKADTSEIQSNIDAIVALSEVEDEMFDRFGFEAIVIQAASNKFGTVQSCQEFTRRISAAT